MTETSTVVVTIGRNVGVMPMPHEEWLRFILDVEDALKQSGLNIIQRPRLTANQWQVGEWEGVREDAAAFVALSSGDYKFSPGSLRDLLHGLCIRYKQDAIGYLVVSNEHNNLVTSNG